MLENLFEKLNSDSALLSCEVTEVTKVTSLILKDKSGYLAEVTEGNQGNRIENNQPNTTHVERKPPKVTPVTSGYLIEVTGKTFANQQGYPGYQGYPEKQSFPNQFAKKYEPILLHWFAQIDETDPDTIADILANCRRDPEGAARLLAYIRETTPTPSTNLMPDNRRSCIQCAAFYSTGGGNHGDEIDGRCQNWDNPLWRSNIDRERLRRCEWFVPKPDDPGQQ